MDSLTIARSFEMIQHMETQATQLKRRPKQFAIRAVTLFRSLPRTEDARIMGRQLLRSATSAAANYRAVCRARSKPEFIARIGIVVEEADENGLLAGIARRNWSDKEQSP